MYTEIMSLYSLLCTVFRVTKFKHSGALAFFERWYYKYYLTILIQAHLPQTQANLPGLNNTIAFKHAYSVESICTRLNLATTFCSSLMSAIPATILSVGALSTCSPAAERSGPMSTGRENWAALKTNNSLQHSSNKIAWSRNGRSRNVGIFLAHVTDIYSSCTADSYSDSGEGWKTIGGPSVAFSFTWLGLECAVLGEDWELFSLVSIMLVIERKLRFLVESGDWLLFWPW